MDFFKSVFSTDADVADPQEEEEEEEEEEEQLHPEQEKEKEKEEEDDDEEGQESSRNPDSSPNTPSSFSVGAWNFGGLIKTISTKSESVIQTYRRDLEEFSSGLKKETAVFKEVASRVVQDLPGSLEVGASVAQESLETVGQAIDDFGGSVWRGTAEIISHGKEALLAVDSEPNSPSPKLNDSQFSVSNSKRYSRFEAQVVAIQNDASTFVEEVDDVEGFEMWKLGFKLEEKEEEIERLLYDNGILEGFFERFVPEVVDRETFWGRYFYRVYRLKQAEDARAKLVKRVIEGEEEEELSWEVDDDDENNDDTVEEIKETKEENKVEAEAETSEKAPIEEAKDKEVVQQLEETIEEVKEKEEEISDEPVVEKKPVETSQVENSEEEEKNEPKGEENSCSKTDGKVDPEARSEPGESSKDSDFTVVSSQPSIQEEDDLGWDEIEDLGDHDDKKISKSSGSPKRVDLRKKMNVAEDDEDLSWDIEDDED